MRWFNKRRDCKTDIPNPQQDSVVGKLQADQSGFALTEFAFALPVMMALSFYGLEVANYTIVQLRISQAALSLADNASRMAQTDSTAITRTITESDINAVMTGASLQAGKLDLFEHGRVILSSLELNTKKGQRIRWQRCTGAAQYVSSYGGQGTGANNPPPSSPNAADAFIGMGLPGREIQASTGTAVMYVQIFYDYEPMFSNLFFDNKMIQHEAAFNIRDTRTLNVLPVQDGGQVQSCSQFRSEITRT